MIPHLTLMRSAGVPTKPPKHPDTPPSSTLKGGHVVMCGGTYAVIISTIIVSISTIILLMFMPHLHYNAVVLNMC